MRKRKLVLGSVAAAAVIGLGVAGIGISSADEIPGNNGDRTNIGVGNYDVAIIQKNIALPANQVYYFARQAEGNQIYRCDSGTWVFDHPEAKSLPDRFVGLDGEFEHDRGPIWREVATGAVIHGSSRASAGATDEDIPQLLLQVTGFDNPNNAQTDYGRIQYIQRLNTKGGTVNHITKACTADNDGALEPVPYSALYAFSRARG